MKNTEIMNKIGGTFNKIGFGLKKHSPELLVAAGVVGTIASAVMACRATMKINDILDEAKKQIDTIHKYTGDSVNEEKYSEEDAKKDTAIVYAQTGAKLAKLYAPAIGLGILSLSSILTSNNILRKRNAALAAAYTAVDRSFKEYRSRVVERFGEEVDHQLRYNIKAVEIEETTTDAKGKEKTVKKTIDVADTDTSSPYARYFTKANPYWEDNSDYVEMFLHSQQNYANDLLRARGHVTLNEIYDMLGMKENKVGMVVGWIYDMKNPIGDNYIEFDVKKVHIKSEYGDGFEEAYIIDFNVDGNIYNEMA